MSNIFQTETAIPVQKQLDAYNQRDIEAFMLWWSNDCEYYAFPNTLLAKGKEAICERHVERFKEPDLFGKLLTRAIVGNMVVDYEIVTRNYPEGLGEVDVICIYEVKDNTISKAWFKMGEPRILKTL